MSDKELQKELESLRSEVAALSKARAAEQKAEKAAKAAPEPSASGQATAAAIAEAAAIDIEDPEAVQTQIDKLLEQLEKEIRDLPTITTLAVFSLGVLFGRLLR